MPSPMPFKHSDMRRLLVTLGLLAPATASAVSITQYWSCSGFLYCGGGTNAVVALAANLITGVAISIGALAVIVFFYGAIRMVTSQGQEGKEAGRKALIYAALGLVAALLTGAIIEFITDYLYLLGGP